MAERSLRERTVKGVGWSAADVFLGQGVTFIVGLILARLLSPEEYGLVGIVLIFTTILSSIVDSGFSRALIRKKVVTNDDYNTMFITNMVLSIVLFVLLSLTAPFIALFFSRPELVPLTRVMGLILVFQALSITQTTILTRRIDFKTKTKASIVSAVLSGVLGIIMAYMGLGVWALVGQKLSNTLVYSLCLWVLIKWWPQFRFSLSSFHYMWGFGWKLMVAGLIDNTWNQLYQVVVGKFYAPSTLGQYSRAKEYASIFSSNLTTVIQRVTYPALSEVQSDTARLVPAYRRIIRITMFVTATTMISLAAVSEPLVFCLIGEKWAEAASYLPLICLSMSLYPLHAINLNMLQVQGRSDLFLYLEIIKKAIAICPLCLGIFVGIYWMLVGSIIVGFLSFFLNSYYTGRQLGYTSWMQLKDVFPSYRIAFIVALSVYFIKFLPVSYWVILPSQITVGSLVLILLCELTKAEEYEEIKRIIVSYISKNN